MAVRIIATPCHKEVPRNDLSEDAVNHSDNNWREYVGYVVTDAIGNVRNLGHDMRDDWTIVVAFKGIG